MDYLDREEIIYAVDLASLLEKHPWVSDPEDELHLVNTAASRQYIELRAQVPGHLSDEYLRNLSVKYSE